jgi:hypothetical protein
MCRLFCDKILGCLFITASTGSLVTATWNILMYAQSGIPSNCRVVAYKVDKTTDKK